MRIAVIGAGAVGSVIGGLLARAGHEVTLVARPEQLGVLRGGGLHISGAAGDFVASVQATDVLQTRPDLALLAVKTQDVVGAVAANLPNLAGTTIVTMQNGVQSDELVATLLPREAIVSSVVFLNATYEGAGQATLASPGSLIIGRPFRPNDRQVETVADVLGQALPTHVSSNVAGAHWLKLIVNLNNALAAITNLTMPEITADAYLRTLSVYLMREGLRVADRAHLPLESLPGMSVRLVRLVGWLPVSMAGRLTARQVQRLDRGWPVVLSTLQSMRRGRPSEIDYLNGEVVRLGERVSVPTPANSTAVRLVHEVERSRHYLQAAEVRREMEAGARDA